MLQNTEIYPAALIVALLLHMAVLSHTHILDSHTGREAKIEAKRKEKIKAKIKAKTKTKIETYNSTPSLLALLLRTAVLSWILGLTS